MPLYSTACPLPISRKIFRHKGSASPIPQTDLALWLKADAGLTTTPEIFISQVVISGAGTTTSNGTYTRSSGGEETQFDGPNGNFIYRSGDWYLYDDTASADTYYLSALNFSGTWQLASGDPDAPTSTTSTQTGNTLITAWADQSGNGNNAVGADTLPTLQSNAINGYPAIRFNNDGEDISKFTIDNSFNLKNSSAFVVVKQLDLDTAYARMLGFLGSNDDYDSDDGLAFLFNNTIPQLQLTSNANDAFVYNLVAENVFALVSYKIDNSGNMSVFYNGVLGDTGGNFDMASQNSGTLYIGQGSQNLDGSGLYGDIAEVILYNSNLTTPQRQQVEAYLNTKYAIY